MSRIGKIPVEVPDGVDIQIAGQLITVKGSLGELNNTIASELSVTQEEKKIWVKPRGTDIKSLSMWGLGRTIVSNMVAGVSKGFTRKLEIV